MSQHSHSLTSETGIRRLIVLAALLVVSACLALLWTGKRPGLADARAYESALLARHLAAGHGFATSVHRPLVTAAQPAPTPDVVQPPAYPLLQALAFRFSAPSANSVAVLGFGVWLVTAWLLWLAARAWWDDWVALIALVFYAAGTGLIAATGGGLPQPLLALCLLGAWWFGFPKPADDRPVVLPAWRLALTGLLAGVAVLTDYLMWPLVLVLAVGCAWTQPRRGVALAAVLTGSLVVLAPWWVRNLLVAGGRPWGWFLYEALTNTRDYPGWSVWLATTPPAHPFAYFITHPLELARKFFHGLLQLRAAGQWLDPVVLFLFVTALFSAPAGGWRKRLAITTTAALLFVVVPAGLVRPDARLLLAWWPLLAAVAAAQLVVWTKSCLEERPLVGRAGLVLALGLVLAPLGPLIVRPPGRADALAQEEFNALAERLPATGVIVTDAPAQAAWFLNRPALALPLAEEGLERLTVEDGIAAIHLVGTDGPAWWRWIGSERGSYRDLIAVSSQLPGRVRAPLSATGRPRDVLFEHLRAETKASPLWADAQTQLGRGCLQRGRLREADTAFQAARQLEPDHLAAQLGLWETGAHLNYSDGTLRLAQLAAQLADGDPRTAAALEQATQHFIELSRRGARQPWVTLQLALCATRLGQEPAATAHLATLDQQLPPTLPARLLLAEALAQAGHTEAALKECRRLDAALPTGSFLLGRLLLETNQPELALAAFTQAANARPDWGQPRLFAAEASRRLQRYEPALTWAAAAAKLPATARPAQLALAAVHAAAGRHAPAEQLYRAALANSPEHPMALTNLAEVLAKQDKTTEALTLTVRLLALYPNSPPILDTIGWVHFRAGQLDFAAKHLHRATQLAPRSASAWFHLGQVLQAQGQKTEAASVFRRALKLGLTDADKQAAEEALQSL